MSEVAFKQLPLLASINEQLRERGLKPLLKLGDHTQGEIEITGQPIEIYDYNKAFFTDVHFPIILPNGEARTFSIRWNANNLISDGAVFIVMMNRKLVIVKQWRLPLGRWTYEIPRGFGEKLDNAAVNGQLGTLKIADLPLNNVYRELGEEVAKITKVDTITHLGNIAENSGTSVNAPAHYLISLSLPEDKLTDAIKSRSEDTIKVQLWPFAQAWNEMGSGRLTDNFSITALALLKKHMESLSL